MQFEKHKSLMKKCAFPIGCSSEVSWNDLDASWAYPVNLELLSFLAPTQSLGFPWQNTSKLGSGTRTSKDVSFLTFSGIFHFDV